MANLYYDEDLSNEAFEIGSLIEIRGDEARHAVRVARLRAGEQIVVGNGAGAVAQGEVVAADRDSFAVRVNRVERVPAPPVRITLVQALAKGDRDERAVEQATEFGVDAIAPWQAERSVSRWQGAGGADKAAKGVEKWRRIAREAAKQSLRAWMPEVFDPFCLDELCDLAGRSDAAMLVLHPRGTEMLSKWANGSASSLPNEIYLVVGPEGGLSEHEIDTLQHAGAKVLVLGDTVLRTSSAGPAALAVLNVTLGRW